LDNLVINIHVAKPILILGKKGSKLFTLRNKLSTFLAINFTSRKITINVIQVVFPSLDSRFLADFIRQQLEKRIPFRKAMKTVLSRAKKAGAKGIKVQISGRLNGAEIARTEWAREGRVPLHTLKADIDYYSQKAREIFIRFLI
jgi:small subunit ribosomal protein S3